MGVGCGLVIYECELIANCLFFNPPRMLRVKEQGIQRRLWKEIYQTKPKCTTRSGFSALTMIDISPAIIILTFGICSSLVILCGEILFEKYRGKGKYV